MQGQGKKSFQVEILEYNQSYATPEEIKKVFFENLKGTANMNSLSCIHISMKRKYGNFSYVIMAALILIVAIIFYALLSLFNQKIIVSTWVLSLIFSAMLNVLFAYLMVRKMYGRFLMHGRNMLPDFDDVDKKFKRDGGNFWIAVLHNTETNKREVVGTLGLTRDMPKENESQEASKFKKLGHITAVGVNAEYRSFGIGRKLCEEVISFAEKNGYDYLDLHTAAVNIPGVNLYKKYGFEIKDQIEVLPLIGFAVNKMGRRIN